MFPAAYECEALPVPDHQEIAIREPSILSELATFLRSRWRGEAPLAIVFWRDMIAVGTVLNVFSGVLALILYALEAPMMVVLTVFFGFLPWNFFLFLAVWRSAGHVPPSVAFLSRASAAAWLVAVIVI